MTSHENKIPEEPIPALIEPAPWSTAAPGQIVADLQVAVDRARRGEWKIDDPQPH